jgi:hypothetical protein
MFFKSAVYLYTNAREKRKEKEKKRGMKIN